MFNSTEHEILLCHKNQKKKKKKKKKKYQQFKLFSCWTQLSMKKFEKNCLYFKIYKQNKFHAQLIWAWKKKQS